MRIGYTPSSQLWLPVHSVANDDVVQRVVVDVMAIAVSVLPTISIIALFCWLRSMPTLTLFSAWWST
jgi:hypothetical protein